jgi:hypothetical protein
MWPRAVKVGSDLEGGSRLTRSIAAKLGKPCLHFAREDVDGAGVRGFLLRHGVRVLNVAGPRASKEPGVYAFAFDLLDAVFPAAT